RFPVGKFALKTAISGGRRQALFGALRLTSFLLAMFPVLVAGQTPQLVDVGGYRLDVLRAGAGAPAIILEAGLGNTLDTWTQIWPAAAEFSTVVAYSRSGLGRSESGP